MNIKINSIPIRAFFDSGSDVSLLSYRWIEKFQLSVNEAEKKKLVKLNGSVWSMGTTRLDVEVDDAILRLNFRRS